MTNFLDKHLVDGWRDSWRWASVQFAAVSGVVGTTLAAHTDVILALLPMLAGSGWLQWVIITITLFAILLRLWNQRKRDNAEV